MSPQFEFPAIFESQVEPHNRDFALKAGKHVFKAYKLCGAYDDLLKQLQQSVEPPRFEFKVDGLIEGVPFTGKPNCRFVLDLGQGRIPCIYDWKVRGYCSKHGASPSKGYAVCLDGFIGKASRSQGKEHAMYKARFLLATANPRDPGDHSRENCRLWRYWVPRPVHRESSGCR
jgi:hypothetical protein